MPSPSSSIATTPLSNWTSTNTITQQFDMSENSLFAGAFFLPDDLDNAVSPAAGEPSSSDTTTPLEDSAMENFDDPVLRVRKSSLSAAWADVAPGVASPFAPSSPKSRAASKAAESSLRENRAALQDRRRRYSNLSPANHMWNDERHAKSTISIDARRAFNDFPRVKNLSTRDLREQDDQNLTCHSTDFTTSIDPTSFFASIFDEKESTGNASAKAAPSEPETVRDLHLPSPKRMTRDTSLLLSNLPSSVQQVLESFPLIGPLCNLAKSSPPIFLTLVEAVPVYLCVYSKTLPIIEDDDEAVSKLHQLPGAPPSPIGHERRAFRPKSPARQAQVEQTSPSFIKLGLSNHFDSLETCFNLGYAPQPSDSVKAARRHYANSNDRLSIKSPTNTTSVKFLLRRADNLQYVNASTLLRAGGIDDEKELGIVLSLERQRLRLRSPPSTRHTSVSLEGTWIPLFRARALAATCSLNHLSVFLSDELPRLFPMLPVAVHSEESEVSGSATTGPQMPLTARLDAIYNIPTISSNSRSAKRKQSDKEAFKFAKIRRTHKLLENKTSKPSQKMPPVALMSPSFPSARPYSHLATPHTSRRSRVVGIPKPDSFFSEAHARISAAAAAKKNKETLSAKGKREAKTLSDHRARNSDSDATESAGETQSDVEVEDEVDVAARLKAAGASSKPFRSNSEKAPQEQLIVVDEEETESEEDQK